MRSVVRSRDIEALRDHLRGYDHHQIADELLRLDPVDQAVVFRTLDKDTALRVFESLDRILQRRLLDNLSADEVTEIFARLETDDRARLLDEMPAKVAARLLEQATPAERADIAMLLGYPPESAGRMMAPEYVSATAVMTVTEALDTIRTSGLDGEAIYVLYVLDDARRLIGIVPLGDLVLAAPDVSLDVIMSADPVSASTTDDQEDVGRSLIDHGLFAVPVVDAEGRLVGVVTIDDALDVIEREATEDVERVGGASPLDQPYLSAPVTRVFRARVGWLLVLFLAEALTGTVLRSFESTLEATVALAFFLPLLIDTGGNVGSQTTTTVVRAMAIGEVRFGDISRVVWKELRVGLLLGATMAAAGIVRASTWGSGGDLALVVGMSLICIVILATAVGSILPIVLKRLRLDPAVVSAPFITTFVDGIGILIYLGLAKAIL